MIPILDRRTVPGFWPWSDKGGVAHVQPPAAILERMVAFRLHLDDCPAESGPLRVIPGSHRLGILSDEGIARARETMAEQTITAEKGDGLLMRPLLLHASSAVAGPAEHRRVLHIEWAVDDLPGGLEWHSRV
ncbi:MAG: phytanoyl-CoA dioxygenase family protein [Capsulimonadales bacterium]|nr:phytanoyl-CoA dioxygenase family protein [Capsulimonadales bacterium]